MDDKRFALNSIDTTKENGHEANGPRISSTVLLLRMKNAG
jgi:hypothetical protein